MKYTKILSITVALIIVMSMTACGASGSAYKQFSNAGKSMTEAKNASMDVTAKLFFNDGEEDVELLLSGTNKIIRKSDKEIEALEDQTLSISGEIVDESQLYFKKDYIYVVNMDEKYRGKFLYDDYLAGSNFSIPELDEESIIEQSTKKIEENNITELTLKVNSDAITDFLDIGLGTMTDMFGGEYFTYGDATIIAQINSDKKIVSFSITSTFSVFEDEEKIDGNVELIYENITFEDATIDFPADLDSYEEINFYEESSDIDLEDMDMEDMEFEDMEIEDMDFEDIEFEEDDSEDGDADGDDSSDDSSEEKAE